jgi:hypothetical protein
MPHTPEEIPVIRNRRSSPKKGGPKPSLLCPTTGDYVAYLRSFRSASMQASISPDCYADLSDIIEVGMGVDVHTFVHVTTPYVINVGVVGNE